MARKLGKSEAEILFNEHLKELEKKYKKYKYKFVKEYVFHPTRKWRFDFALVESRSHPLRLAIEIEGGTWSKSQSRHTSGTGFAEDCVKYNEAVLLRWDVLRFTTDMVLNGKAKETIDRWLTQQSETEDWLDGK